MYSKEPLWLLPEEVIKKYEDFCFMNGINEKRLVKLFDVGLLRGNDNRQTRKIEILEESFEDLRNHIKYNHFLQGSKADAVVKMPVYIKYRYKIYYEKNYHWHTPAEALKTYSNILQYEKNISIEFIGELVSMNVVIGRYKPSESSYQVFLPSFTDLIKYREYSVEKNHWLPPPEIPPEDQP